MHTSHVHAQKGLRRTTSLRSECYSEVTTRDKLHVLYSCTLQPIHFHKRTVQSQTCHQNTLTDNGNLLTTYPDYMIYCRGENCIYVQQINNLGSLCIVVDNQHVNFFVSVPHKCRLNYTRYYMQPALKPSNFIICYAHFTHPITPSRPVTVT